MRRRNWTHYAAPVAFLLAVTIAVLLVRSAMTGGDTTGTVTTLPPPPTRKTVATTTTKKPPKQTAPRFYTVVAGDTFGVISSKTGVPVARIAQLNPGADSNALFIGQKLRLR